MSMIGVLMGQVLSNYVVLQRDLIPLYGLGCRLHFPSVLRI